METVMTVTMSREFLFILAMTTMPLLGCAIGVLYDKGQSFEERIKVSTWLISIAIVVILFTSIMFINMVRIN